jgi:uncharacterized protein DUF4440
LNGAARKQARQELNMTARTTWIAALVCLGTAARGDDARIPAAGAEELERLTQRRFDANAANDRAFYEQLLAPNFLLLEPFSFPAKTKTAYLAAEFPQGRLPRPKSSIGGFRAHLDGDTAVVSYEVSEPFPLGGGQEFKQVSRRLDTYVRTHGAWRLVAMAIAEPPSWPPVATVAPGLYSEYSGAYRLSSEALAIVTNEDGHLMLQLPDQPKVELFPESATSFFDTTDSPHARTIFERDASGKVVAQVYRSGGQLVRASKIR